MECASSCSIFEAFSSALEWVAKTKLGVSEMIHYIDDFLFLAEFSAKCTADMNAFIPLCEQMGVPLAPEKTQGPTSILPFLGIILDTVKLEARLPDDKLAKCKSMIADFLTRQKVSLQQLQSLLGLLGYAVCVVVSGRCFMQCLIDLTIGVTRPHHHVRLTNQDKLDLRRPAGREIKKIRFSDHVIFRCIGILYSSVQEHISIFQEKIPIKTSFITCPSFFKKQNPPW